MPRLRLRGKRPDHAEACRVRVDDRDGRKTLFFERRHALLEYAASRAPGKGFLFTITPL